jgi:hypothetical protein
MSIARLGEGELRAGDAQHAAASLNSAREIAKTASSARTNRPGADDARKPGSPNECNGSVILMRSGAVIKEKP